MVGFLPTHAMKYGYRNKATAKLTFDERTGTNVQDSCFFFVNKKYGLLGAIVEIKCPGSAKILTISKASKKLTNFFIDKKTLQLKERRNYDYQIHRQREMSEREKCFFVVWNILGGEYADKTNFLLKKKCSVSVSR